MITISLCMIVKNEELVLERCLDGLKDLMDEIIIVDTGSADGTKEIAKKYTDQVYDYAWEDDFSKARNYALSFATCDYIYVADADEVLDEENQQKFFQMKQILLPEIEIVQMLYSGQFESNTVYNFDEEYRPKLFKRVREFQFQNPVHEILRTEPLVYDSDIRIFHKPHGIHTERDFRIFEKNYGKNTKMCIPSILLRMYAKELYISGKDEDFVRAVPICEKILGKESCTGEEVQYVSCILARAYRVQKMEGKFFQYAMKVVLTESCSEICMELGKYYEEKEEWSEAHVWYYNAAFETEPICDIRMGNEYALHALCRVAEKLGMPELAEQYRGQIEE